MAKISNLLFKSIFISTAAANTLEVISCNNEDVAERPPALSFKIEESYFRNNLEDQDEALYQLVNGFYERTIPEDELTLEFDPNDDCKWQLLER